MNSFWKWLSLFMTTVTFILTISASVDDPKRVILYDGCLGLSVSRHGLRKDHLYLRRGLEKPDVALEVASS